MRKLKKNYLKPKKFEDVGFLDRYRNIRPETEVVETIINQEIRKVKRFLRRGIFSIDQKGMIHQDGFYFRYVTIKVNVDRDYFAVLKDDRGVFTVKITISQSGIFRNRNDYKRMKINHRNLLIDEYSISRDNNDNIVITFMVLSTKYKLKKKLRDLFKRKR